MTAMSEETVAVGQIGAAHGIRGEVRVKSYTEPAGAIADYGPLTVVGGRGGARTLTVERWRDAGTVLVVKFKEIADRNAAELLNGRGLAVARAQLPEPADDDAFYYADLVGLAVVDGDGRALGRVVAVDNFGASDLVEIAPADGPTVYLPFTKQFVPDVDLAAGRIVIVVPDGLFDRPDPGRKRVRRPPRSAAGAEDGGDDAEGNGDLE
jgi:16S rRNA processing protein RimM